jgi:hypothetical protein
MDPSPAWLEALDQLFADPGNGGSLDPLAVELAETAEA